MPVFDFSAAPEDSRQPECTYTTFQSNEETATPEKPIMILDNTCLLYTSDAADD